MLAGIRSRLTYADVMASIAVFIAFGLAALGGGTSTAASAKRVDSTLRLSTAEPYAHGRVNSSNHACEVNRTVRLFRKEEGAAGWHWVLKGRDRTNDHGQWEIHITRVGEYYAQIRPRRGGGPECGGDRSGIRPIPS